MWTGSLGCEGGREGRGPVLRPQTNGFGCNLSAKPLFSLETEPSVSWLKHPCLLFSLSSILRTSVVQVQQFCCQLADLGARIYMTGWDEPSVWAKKSSLRALHAPFD